MLKDRFKRQLWISFGVIVASAAIATGALYYFSGTIAAQASAIAGDRASVEEKTDAVANLAVLESTAPQAAVYQSAMDQILPDQYGLVTFTQWLGQLGAKYGVTANASFQGAVVPAAGTTPGTAQFSFGAQGPSAALAAFLDGMNGQSSGFIVSLAAFDVTGGSGEENMTGQGTLFFR